MKQNAQTIICLLTAVLLFACTSARHVEQTAELTKEGEKQIKTGIHWYMKGCYPKALDYFFNAHEWFSVFDDQDGVARSLNSIGNSYRHMGDHESALLFYGESIHAARSGNNPRLLVRSLCNRSAAFMDSGLFDEAKGALSEAETLCSTHGLNPALVLHSRGVLLMKKGAYDQAEEVMNQAVQKSKQTDSTTTAVIQYAFGTLLMKTGRESEAIPYFERALLADKKSGFYKGIADDLSALGIVFEKTGQLDNAVDSFKRSIMIYARIGDRKKSVELLDRLEPLAKKTGSDIDVTLYFVKKWLENKTVAPICD